jgi:transcriptional regulator with XRE-family HTH domain
MEGGDKLIGERIKERRKQLGMTQDELASKIGVKKTSVSNYEVNANSPPEKVIIKIMEALNCDANYLFSDYNENESIAITPHERKLILAYRQMPEMQPAIDKLLDIAEEQTIRVYRAAESADDHDDEIVNISASAERVQKIKNAHESDDDDL